MTKVLIRFPGKIVNLGPTWVLGEMHLFESFKQRGIEVIFKGKYRKKCLG